MYRAVTFSHFGYPNRNEISSVNISQLTKLKQKIDKRNNKE